MDGHRRLLNPIRVSTESRPVLLIDLGAPMPADAFSYAVDSALIRVPPGPSVTLPIAGACALSVNLLCGATGPR